MLFISCIWVFTATEYKDKRVKDARKYYEGLDVSLAVAGHKEHSEIRQALSSWLLNYKELGVSSTHDRVYQRVEGLLREATSLGERFPSLTASQYLKELHLLRTKVELVPRIGEEAFNEHFPWWGGYFRWLGKKLACGLGVIGLLVCLGKLVLFFSDKKKVSQPKQTKTGPSTQPSASPSVATDGGSGRYYGVYRSDHVDHSRHRSYEEGRGPYPPHWPPL